MEEVHSTGCPRSWAGGPGGHASALPELRGGPQSASQRAGAPLRRLRSRLRARRRGAGSSGSTREEMVR